jgi:hypothetical protein
MGDHVLVAILMCTLFRHGKPIIIFYGKPMFIFEGADLRPCRSLMRLHNKSIINNLL